MAMRGSRFGKGIALVLVAAAGTIPLAAAAPHPTSSFAPLGYPRSRKNGGHGSGVLLPSGYMLPNL